VRARQNHTPQVVGPLRLGPSGRCAGLARPLCEPQLVVILPVTGAARAPAGVLVGVLPWHALAAVVGDAASVDALLSRQAVIAATARLNRRRR
jgi:hypothetical protein